MPSFGYTAGRRSPLPTFEHQSPESKQHTIQSKAQGFTYVLSAPGGGGGNGGSLIGGGGGGAGEFVEGTIMLAELADSLECEVSQIELSVTLGTAGEACNNGEDSFLNAIGNGQTITLAIAIGGTAGLSGSEYIGYGPGENGTTFTELGGVGEIAIKNEARTRQNQSVFALNIYSDGGDGGDAGKPGSQGKPGYFSSFDLF
jgi:hypothetical protein